MNKPRVLIAHPWVRPSGGGNLVAAWTLEALRADFDVSLATLEPPDFDAVNRSFGTRLGPEAFKVHIAPSFHQRLRPTMPTQSALLDMSLNMRWAQDLDRPASYDVLFCTLDEVASQRCRV